MGVGGLPTHYKAYSTPPTLAHIKNMENVYTVREFRAHMKQAFEAVEEGNRVHIERNGKKFELVLCTQEEKVRKNDSTKKKSAQKVVEEFVKRAQEEPKFIPARESGLMYRYDCGCPKTDNVLCDKHGRY